MRKRISLNPLTIKQCNSMEEQIRIAAETGFGGIGLRGDAIARYLSSGNSIESLKGFVEKHGLMITDVGSLGGWQFTGTPPLVCRLRLDKPVPDEVLERQVRRYLANVRDIGCEYVLAVSAINEEGTVERAVEDFARLCDLTAEYELKVALEFVGFGKQVNNVRIAWDIIREADRVNGGLLFDTFHFYRGASSIEDLMKIPQERIFLVHVNDVKALPREAIRDQDRLYPGLGIVPLGDILGALKTMGYSGYYSVEIFNDDYWLQDPSEVAIIARKSTQSVLEAVYGATSS